MVTPHLLHYIYELLNTAASVTPASITLTDVNVVNTTSITMATINPSPFTNGVVEFEEGIYRVVNTVATTSLSWHKPLEAVVSVPVTITLMNTPLAGSAVYIGGGIPRTRTITITIENEEEEIFGLGSGYGARKEGITGGILLQWSAGELQDYRLNYYRFLMWKYQVKYLLFSNITRTTCFSISFVPRTIYNHYIDKSGSTTNVFWEALIPFTCESLV